MTAAADEVLARIGLTVADLTAEQLAVVERHVAGPDVASRAHSSPAPGRDRPDVNPSSECGKAGQSPRCHTPSRNRKEDPMTDPVEGEVFAAWLNGRLNPSRKPSEPVEPEPDEEGDWLAQALTRNSRAARELQRFLTASHDDDGPQAA